MSCCRLLIVFLFHLVTVPVAQHIAHPLVFVQFQLYRLANAGLKDFHRSLTQLLINLQLVNGIAAVGHLGDLVFARIAICPGL